MSYHSISKSTKRRRFSEELEMIDLNDQNNSEFEAQLNITICNTDNHSTSNITNNFFSDFSNIDNINTLIDEYELFSLLSNSDSEDELITNNENISNDHLTDSSILNDLAKWALSYNITQTALSALLKILKVHNCHSYFSTDSRTILKTKSSIQPLQIQTISPGSYYYFKIYDNLKHIYNLDNQYFIENELKIVIGIDGLPLTKSSSSCFWPILGYIRHPCYTPYVFLIGLYWGKDKPFDCNLFLLDFVNEIKELHREGFQTDSGTKRVVINVICCDLPAKSYILKTKGHSGYNSCARCTITGVYYENRVCFPGINYIKRTHNDFINRTDEEFHMTNTVSLLTEIPGIDIINSLSLDYMHLVCIGVTKKIILLWLGCIKNSPISVRIQNKKVVDITNSLLALKPSICCDFCRVPRGLNEVSRWKATEFHQFLLYTGPVVLKDIINNECYQHFICLHVSFRIFLTSNVSIDLVNFTEKILSYFVQKFHEIYGREFISLNVHSLLHIVDDYKRFGSLDNCSCFPFENFMKTLKKMIRKHEKPLEQVVKRYSEFQTFGETKLNKINDVIEYLKPYNKGPFLEGCHGPAFRIVIKSNIKINIKSSADIYIGYILEDRLNIFKIVSICFNKNNETKVFLAQAINKIQPFYKKPINSLKLGIAIVDELSKYLIEIEVEKCNYSKYMIINYDNSKIAFPILHSIYN